MREGKGCQGREGLCEKGKSREGGEGLNISIHQVRKDNGCIVQQTPMQLQACTALTYIHQSQISSLLREVS